MIALRPAVLVAAFYGVIVVALLASHAWDPRFFATVGPQWQRHDPGLRKQADGSIYYEFASDPVEAAARRDRFRTARILYPAVAHVLALGRTSLVGWTLLLVNVFSIVLGTAILQRLLERRGLPGWAALAYGLWGGLGVALLHGTAEPVAYLCVLAGLDSGPSRSPVGTSSGSSSVEPPRAFPRPGATGLWKRLRIVISSARDRGPLSIAPSIAIAPPVASRHLPLPAVPGRGPCGHSRGGVRHHVARRHRGGPPGLRACRHLRRG